MEMLSSSSALPSSPLTRSSPAGRTSGARLDPLAFDASIPSDGSMPTNNYNTNNGQGHTGGPDGGQTADRDADDGAPASRNARPRKPVNIEEIAPVVDETGERVREHFVQFLTNYVEEPLSGSPDPDGDGYSTERPYVAQISALSEFQRTTLFVDFTHLLRYQSLLAEAVSQQYYRFLPYLRRAVADLVAEVSPEYLYINAHAASTASSGLKPRDFGVSFYNLALVSGIRDLRTDSIGRLTSISGTVTRTSEVRPELIYGAFKCQECGNVVRDVEQQFKYTVPTMCHNPTCQNTKNWQLNTDQSRFADWQKVRIQENANEIPTGSMPRSLDVILRSEIVERAKAGDKCVFTGTFIVVPDVSQLGVPGVNAQIQRDAAGGRAPEGISQQGVTGLASLGVRDLTYKTAFLACMVQSGEDRKGGNVRDEGEAEDPETLMNALTEEERDELEAMVSTDDIYSRLVHSIAPTVYGHDIVKKGILLQLMGGVHKQTREGIHLRGDINICIVGDPSTSKSQFLKYVCGFLPRAVYTSGKASSAAGLTAAVVRDEETGEFTIEAGALMLADNGICAIDEFDKMDVSDQVAIHEAMEQQTISIAKAGLQATLNARTSILAAANPVGGRYNRKMTLRANVAMSAPIMSRFDLFFVVLDECNENVDMNIAQHIINVHRFKDSAIAPEFSTEAIQRYIRYARTFQPKLTPEASDVLVEKYRQLREDDAGAGGKNSYRITVRQLESMIRLSEAIARANCRQEITPAFVREAFSLLRQSIIHVEKDDIDFEDEEEDDDALHREREQQQRQQQQQASPMEESMDADMSSAAATLADPATASSAPTTAAAAAETSAAPSSRRRLKITHDRYIEMLNLLVMRVNEMEKATGSGINRRDLIQWYLEQRESEIETLEQLEEERELAAKVVVKLIKDQYFIELRNDEDETQPDGDEEDLTASQEPILMVHPKVDLDNLGSSLE